MADHDVSFELFYDGAWRWAPVLTRDVLTLRRGSTDLGDDTEPAIAPLTLASSDYAPRSLVSPLRGKIGQNTKGRISIDGAVRLSGEVASWKPQRPIKGSGWTEIELAGVLRRIGRGTDPIRSALYRAYADANPTLYWSLEDAKGTTTAGGSAPLELTSGTVAFNGDVGIVGSAGALDTAGGGSMRAALSGEAFSATGWQVEFSAAYRNSTVGTPPIIINVYTSGDATLNFTVSSTLWDGKSHHVAVQLTQVGADINVDTYRDGVLAANSVLPGLTLGVPVELTVNRNGNSGDNQPVISHLAFFSTINSPAGRAPAAIAWTGETAADRFSRFCLEEGVTPTVVGDPAESVAMGPQQTVPRLEVFDEIARTDDASIFETRDDAGLTMRTGVSKLNQAPAFTISYLGQIVPPLEPVVGDDGIRNDVTAAAPDGTTRRVVQLDGPHNVELPEDDPQGVGRYGTRIDVNPATADALSDAAGWRVNQGTYDGTWYAEVTADLDAAPGIAAAVAALDIGDVLAISELPVDEALDTVEGIIIGIREQLPEGGKRRLVTFYLVPYAPYRVGVLAETSGDTDPVLGHLETDGSTTVGAVAVGASSFSVATPSGPLWTTDADDFPFDIIAGGQRVSISSISGASSPQTFTVQSAALGGRQVVYVIPAGSPVIVQQPVILAL